VRAVAGLHTFPGSSFTRARTVIVTVVALENAAGVPVPSVQVRVSPFCANATSIVEVVVDD